MSDYRNILKKLSKSKYAMPYPGDDEEQRAKERVKRKKVNNGKILGVSVICWATFILIGKLCCVITGFNGVLNSENLGDYLSLFAAQCSVVFLTTSLMTMLSEKSKYVYHVDLVELVLINPPCYNFKALATYAIESVGVAMLGFLVKRGSLIIGGFIFGIVAVVILFWRMIMIYYRKDDHKKEIREFLRDTIKLSREMEDKGEVDKYQKEMAKIGYNRRFEAILNQGLIELENNNISAVFEAIELLEDCIQWHVGTIYDDDTKEKNKKNIEDAYKIITSDIGLPRSYHAMTRTYLEKYYIDYASVVAMKYPEELQRYYNNRFAPKPSEYLKMIRSIVFPCILNRYIEENRKQKFYDVLTKWSSMNTFWFAIRKYLVSCVLNGNAECLAEYYKWMGYSNAGDLDCAESGMGIIFPSDGIESIIFDEHEQILEEIYNESVEVFEQILSYSENRKKFMFHFVYDKNGELCIEQKMEKIVHWAEKSTKNTEPTWFLWAVQTWMIDLLVEEDKEIDEKFWSVVKCVIELKNCIWDKTNKDVDYLLQHLHKLIHNMDFICPLYIRSTHQWEFTEEQLNEGTKKYLFEYLKSYKNVLNAGVDVLKKTTTPCMDKENPRNIVERVSILEKHLGNVKQELSRFKMGE